MSGILLMENLRFNLYCYAKKKKKWVLKEWGYYEIMDPFYCHCCEYIWLGILLKWMWIMGGMWFELDFFDKIFIFRRLLSHPYDIKTVLHPHSTNWITIGMKEIHLSKKS